MVFFFLPPPLVYTSLWRCVYGFALMVTGCQRFLIEDRLERRTGLMLHCTDHDRGDVKPESASVHTLPWTDWHDFRVAPSCLALLHVQSCWYCSLKKMIAAQAKNGSHLHVCLYWRLKDGCWFTFCWHWLLVTSFGEFPLWTDVHVQQHRAAPVSCGPMYTHCIFVLLCLWICYCIVLFVTIGEVVGQVCFHVREERKVFRMNPPW